MVGTAELILFAMQAGIKLAQAGRKIYVENTQSRRLDLPIPSTISEIEGEAMTHAAGLRGSNDPVRKKRFASVFKEAYNRVESSPTEAGRAEALRRVVDLFIADIAQGWVSSYQIDFRESAGLLAFRQWSRGDNPNPSPLQRAAGALIEVAIDYFVRVPGALDEKTRHGRVIKSFLTALDAFDFQESRWDSVVIGMFTAAVETVAESPDLLSGADAHEQIVKESLKGVAGQMQTIMQQVNAKFPEGHRDAEDRVLRFGQLVTRVILRQAGAAVLDSPLVGETGEDEAALIQGVGSALIALLLDDTGEDGDYDLQAAFRRVASTRGLEKLTSAAMRAAAEHPDIFGLDNAALRDWIQHIVAGLYEGHANGGPLFDSDLLAEAAYLVIDNGLRDLPGLLKLSDKKKAMLVSVSRLVFESLVEAPAKPGDPVAWKLHLSPSDVRGVFAAVLQAFADNPHWLVDRRDMQKALAPLMGLASKALLGLGPDLLSVLVRSGELSGVVSAILASGILEEIDEAMAGRAGDALQMVLDRLAEEGTAGVSEIFKGDRLLDLLRALARANDPVLEKLLGGSAAEARKVAEGLVEIIGRLRDGERVRVPVMVETLNAKAA